MRWLGCLRGCVQRLTLLLWWEVKGAGRLQDRSSLVVAGSDGCGLLALDKMDILVSNELIMLHGGE